MTLEGRLRQLEAILKCQDTRYGPNISTDSIIRKLVLDPDTVRATAKENNQSIAEVTAGKLGRSYGDFQKTLKLRAGGKDTS